MASACCLLDGPTEALVDGSDDAGRWDQGSRGGRSFASGHDRLVPGADERFVEMRKDLFGAADGVSTNRGERISNVKDRELHPSSGSPSS